MTSLSYGLSTFLMVLGAFFFIVGTIGLLRFPDIYTRLHALTKADNLGLGLLVAGLALQTDTLTDILKLIVIWLLVLAASATIGFLIARTTLNRGITPRNKP